MYVKKNPVVRKVHVRGKKSFNSTTLSYFVLSLGEKEITLSEHRVQKVICGPVLLPSLSLPPSSPSPSPPSPTIHGTPVYVRICGRCSNLEIKLPSSSSPLNPINFFFYISNCLYSVEAKEKELNRRDENYK